MEKIKVLNMNSPRTGRKVANQYIIKDRENRCIYFQSYSTIIAKIDFCGRTGEVTLIKGATSFSKTTNKYLYKFLDDYSLINESYNNKNGIARLIACGEIKEVGEF